MSCDMQQRSGIPTPDSWKMARKLGKSKDTLKTLLAGFNVLFWFTGPGILGLGIWLRLLIQELDVVIEHAQYELPMYLLLVSGSAVVVFGIIGCIAIYNENKCLVAFYSVCLVFVFAAETATCVKSFLLYDKIESQVFYRFNISLRYRYMYDEEATKSIDSIQQRFGCCGIYSAEDWANTNFNLRARSLVSKGIQPYPVSCCIDSSDCNLAVGGQPNINHNGCLPDVVGHASLIINIACWSTLACAALMIIGFVMMCCFRIAISR